jgi:hypothetical protein
LTRPRALVAGAVALVLLAALLAFAANDDAPPEFTVTKVDGVPFLNGATSGPGTELGAGLRVPPGARLLGTTIPIETVVIYRGTPIPDRGWQAWMFVSGDPIAALRSVATQARGAGLTVGGLGCPEPESASFAFCGVSGQHVSSNRVRWLSAGVWRGTDRMLDAPLSHLVVEYHDHQRLPDNFPILDDDQQGDSPIPVMPSLPRRWRPLPGPGDELALAPFRARQLHVEPGTHVVAPYSAGCAATYNAVLAVDGDPVQVMRAYSRQVAGLDSQGDPAHVRERRDGDARVLEFNQVSRFEQYLGHLVIRPGQPRYLFIETCMSS